MERDTLGVRRGDCGHMLLCSCVTVPVCPCVSVCLSERYGLESGSQIPYIMLRTRPLWRTGDL